MRFSFEASDAVGSQWHTSANRLMLNLPISDRTSFGAVGSLRAFPGADGGVRAVGRRCGFFRGAGTDPGGGRCIRRRRLVTALLAPAAGLAPPADAVA